MNEIGKGEYISTLDSGADTIGHIWKCKGNYYFEPVEHLAISLVVIKQIAKALEEYTNQVLN